MTTLSDTALLAAEEAYDEVIRAEGSRSPYMNTRAFRAAFLAASAIEARSGETTEIGSTEGESAVPEGETP
jgi:hypothetical protein